MAWDRDRSGRGGRPWRRKRDQVLARDHGLCQPCRRAGRHRLATQVDHITPVAEGGTDHESNLQSICDTCHDAKTNREARRGKGLTVREPGADTDGIPLDPHHPWNQ